MRVFAFMIILAVSFMVSSASNAQQEIKLKPGPGAEEVEAHCQACHSLSYILMNSGFLNQAGWNAEVEKMIKTFGAPVEPGDAKEIVDYLTKNYGG